MGTICARMGWCLEAMARANIRASRSRRPMERTLRLRDRFNSLQRSIRIPSLCRDGPRTRAFANLFQPFAVGLKPCFECRRDMRESLTCDMSCPRRPVKKAALRPLSADDPDEVLKHIDALSTGIHDPDELPPPGRGPARSVFTCQITVCTLATKQ